MSERMVCPECGSPRIDMVDEESEEMNCAECGYDFNMLEAEWAEEPADPPAREEPRQP